MPTQTAMPLDEEVFDFVAKAEKSVLDAGRQWAKTAEEFVPVELPAVHEVVDGAFEFAETVLKIQRDFAQSVLKTTRSMLTGKTT